MKLIKKLFFYLSLTVFVLPLLSPLASLPLRAQESSSSQQEITSTETVVNDENSSPDQDPTPTPTQEDQPTPTPTDTENPTDSEITPTPSATPTPTDTPTPSLNPTPTDADTTITGDAYASSSSLSQTNTNLVDSELNLALTDVTDENQGDIDLTSTDTPTSVSSATIIATNSATVTNSASASANTGNNTQISSDSALMLTGDALATANAVSLTNLNLINSYIQLGIINVYKTWDGNIILSPPTPPDAPQAPPAPQLVFSQNSATVSASSNSAANTGDNTQTGDQNTMGTGQAIALSNADSVTNLNLYYTYLFNFFISNLNLWSGSIYNLYYPGSRTSAQELNYSQPQNGTSSAQLCDNDNSCSGSDFSVSTQNQANVTTTAAAMANTGGNSQTSQDQNFLLTGNAFASANSLSLTNLNLFGSSFIFNRINLFQPWTGNLIFAYPDLQATLSAPDQVYEGQDINYTLSITNLGYAPAHNVQSNYAINNSGHPVENGQNDFGEILPGETKTYPISFNTSGRANHDIFFDFSLTTPDTEESIINNQISHTTTVLPLPTQSSDQNQDQPEPFYSAPHIHLTVSNNINDFVYPGDHVRYYVTITNPGPNPASDIIFQQGLLDPQQQAIDGVKASLGSLAVGESIKLDYELALSSDLAAGDYSTITLATAVSSSDDNYNTPLIQTPIKIQDKQPSVLGLSTSLSNLNPPQSSSTFINFNPPSGDVLGSYASRYHFQFLLWLLPLISLLPMYYFIPRLRTQISVRYFVFFIFSAALVFNLFIPIKISLAEFNNPCDSIPSEPDMPGCPPLPTDPVVPSFTSVPIEPTDPAEPTVSPTPSIPTEPTPPSDDPTPTITVTPSTTPTLTITPTPTSTQNDPQDSNNNNDNNNSSSDSGVGGAVASSNSSSGGDQQSAVLGQVLGASVLGATGDTSTSADSTLPIIAQLSYLDHTYPIVQGEIKNNHWSLYNNALSQIVLTQSDLVNTIIYGHNSARLLGNLKDLQLGNSITYNQKTYRVTQIRIVEPDQLDILIPRQPDTLTIYTCSGEDYAHRLVVTAIPQ